MAKLFDPWSQRSNPAPELHGPAPTWSFAFENFIAAIEKDSSRGPLVPTKAPGPPLLLPSILAILPRPSASIASPWKPSWRTELCSSWPQDSWQFDGEKSPSFDNGMATLLKILPLIIPTPARTKHRTRQVLQVAWADALGAEKEPPTKPAGPQNHTSTRPRPGTT